MKILVIQKKRIGDVLTSTVILEALRKKYPLAELHYLVYSNSLAVVQHNPFIDKIVVLDEKTRKSKVLFWKFLKQIRSEKYTHVIDAYGKPNSVLIAWFSGAKTTISFNKSYVRWLCSHAVDRNNQSFSSATKAIEHRMLLLEPLQIPFEVLAPKIFLTSGEVEQAKQTLQTNGIDIAKPLVMISAIGSNEWKTYPLPYMKALLEILARQNVQILFNYMPFQQSLAQQLYDLCDPATQQQILIDFYEPDLRKFLAITKLCKALIGNEGGATNMAKALRVPTFTIFSPLVPKADWNMFENGTTNVSVHVSDYFPENTLSNQIDNKEYEVLYQKFTPNLFTDTFIQFINTNVL